MKARQTLLSFILLSLLACNSRQTNENAVNAVFNDSSKVQNYFFSKSEELYIVNRIIEDSIDSVGHKWHLVEMKNSKDIIFNSWMSANDRVMIGDSIWIGQNASGEPYILTINKKSEGGKGRN